MTIAPHIPPITGPSEVCLTLSVEGGVFIVMLDVATSEWGITTG